jgi:hypothetical protein
MFVPVPSQDLDFHRHIQLSYIFVPVTSQDLEFHRHIQLSYNFLACYRYKNVRQLYMTVEVKVLAWYRYKHVRQLDMTLEFKVLAWYRYYISFRFLRTTLRIFTVIVKQYIRFKHEWRVGIQLSRGESWDPLNRFNMRGELGSH